MNTSPAMRFALDELGIDANRVAPGLYLGAAPPRGLALRRAGFRVLCLCAAEIQPPDHDYPGVRVLRARLDDSGPAPSYEECLEAVNAALALLEQLDAGARCLVACHRGWNRSALVTGIVLRLRFGLTGEQCIEHLRAARPKGPVLCNHHFTAGLRGLDRFKRARRPG
jgi:predicted protein tyrosine phosphatase